MASDLYRVIFQRRIMYVISFAICYDLLGARRVSITCTDEIEPGFNNSGQVVKSLSSDAEMRGPQWVTDCQQWYNRRRLKS